MADIGIYQVLNAHRSGDGLSTDRNLSVKLQPRDRFPLLGRGAILGRL
jgi:hypothetical protein